MAKSVYRVISGLNETDRLCFLDLEGAEPNYIDAAAAIICDLTGKPLQRKSSLVNPGDVVWHEHIVALTGITPESVAGAPLFPEIWEAWLRELLETTVVVCHDICADMLRINRDCARYGLAMPSVRTIDTLEVARLCIPGSIKHSNTLSAACKALGIPMQRAHRADADAEGSRRLFCEAFRRYPLPFSHIEVEAFEPLDNPRIIIPRDPAERAVSETAYYDDVFGQLPPARSVGVRDEVALLKYDFVEGRARVGELIELQGGSLEESRRLTADTTLVVIGDDGHTNVGALDALYRLKDQVDELNARGYRIRVVTESSLDIWD